MDRGASFDKDMGGKTGLDQQEVKAKRSLTQILNLGPETIPIIAGPCSIENKEQLSTVANCLMQKSIKILRGGAYKPRTSPHLFQGLGENGLRILKEIGTQYGLTTVSELLDVRHLDILVRYVDVIQIGTRNMYNYELLKEVGRQDKPVLLKRGICATIKEFRHSAEYIASEGNESVILCERGIRTFESSTRHTLDISCVPIMQKQTGFPVIVDLSHSLGRKDIVNAVAKAAFAVGADGIMVELHPNPKEALSDNEQQLDLQEFAHLLDALSGYLNI